MNSQDFLKKALSFDRSEKQYKALAKRIVAKPKLLKLLHSVLGMSGEVGEATDSVKKSLMYGKDLDVQNLKEECGDILWYMSLMLDAVESSFEEVMQMNVDKLSKRYPQGFTEKHAQLRLDKVEREEGIRLENIALKKLNCKHSTAVISEEDALKCLSCGIELGKK